jgi:putative transposase
MEDTEWEQENAKLKRLVANLSLDNLVLKDFASGNF